MAREKNCRWNFAEQLGGREDGPNSAMAQNFKQYPYASLIRESVQNSLDAVYDGTKPVLVEFSFKSINGIEFPSFFTLKDHIKGCLVYYHDNKNAEKQFRPMLNYFSDSRSSQQIGFIKVSDYNTRGMAYVKDDTRSPFYAFVKAAGVTVKDNADSGGSFGFGKAAYYIISPINTVLVSTRTYDNKSFFEGASALCTHTHQGKKYVAVGYYDDQNGNPIENIDDIPVPFRRAESGTDVYIMGFDTKKAKDAKQEMIKATLQNFWLAIYDGKLEICIDGETINSANITDLMHSQYESTKDDSRNNSRHYNPRPFFDAVALAGTAKKYHAFEEVIPLLGKVKFFVYTDKDADDKISYMRKPKMLVEKRKNGTNYGFYGTFVCEDRDGNEILQSMENPAHDEWRPANAETTEERSLARQAQEEMKNFITRCLDSIYESTASESLQITGLENYLYTEDLTTDDDDEEESNNPFTGQPTDDTVPESTQIDTEIKGDRKDVEQSPETTGSVRIIQPGVTTADVNSKDETATGGKHHGGKGGKPKPGNDFRHSTVNTEEEGFYKTFVPARFRVVAQNESGMLYHYIIIHVDEDIEKGEIDLVVGGEQRETALPVAYSDHGTPGTGENSNIISGLSFKAGKNVIKVRFEDNMRHAVILKAYEITKKQMAL